MGLRVWRLGARSLVGDPLSSLPSPPVFFFPFISYLYYVPDLPHFLFRYLVRIDTV